MSGTCTIDVTIDETRKGDKFEYRCTEHSSGLLIQDNKDLNVNGIQNVTLTFRATGSTVFDGFLVSEDTTPKRTRGWTSASAMSPFGIYPLEPNPWPSPSTSESSKELSFKLDLPLNGHIYHFQLIAKHDGQIFYDDPKIYNDPPTEPPPPPEEASSVRRGLGSLEDRVSIWLERSRISRLKAERLRAEAERLEAEAGRLEARAEHLEAERLEAERLEAERLEAERLES